MVGLRIKSHIASLLDLWSSFTFMKSLGTWSLWKLFFSVLVADMEIQRDVAKDCFGVVFSLVLHLLWAEKAHSRLLTIDF